MGLFNFWLILWCVQVVVVVVVVGGARLQWWYLVVLSCDDVGGGVGFVWLVVGVISCRDFELKRERERESYCSTCVFMHNFTHIDVSIF